VKEAKSPDGASHEAKEPPEQRDAPVHRLKHVIEEQRHNDIARGRDEVGGVAMYNKPAANEDHGGCSRQYVEQIKDTGNLGLETRGEASAIRSIIS
jgi:hypothetical protein